MDKTIYLAGGCFWGTEHLFSLVPGVTGTEVGYANSDISNPSYKEVCTGRTNAAETVKVDYNPEKVTLQQLLELYLMSINPLTLNRQGNDVGTQYRTGIYYTSADDVAVVDAVLSELDKRLGRKSVIESGMLKNFYPAEEYHQEYLDKNPGGYCHVNPQLFAVAKTIGTGSEVQPKGKRQYFRPDDATLRARLTPLQWEVTQNAATERPFLNEYDDEFRPGIYVDVTTGEPLFVSTDKFNSGCGWPAFSKPIDGNLIDETTDYTHGMVRTEVKASNSGAHLGHVFPDGPKETGGSRYCINSASLRFVPLDRMESEGYGEYIHLIR